MINGNVKMIYVKNDVKMTVFLIQRARDGKRTREVTEKS